MDADYSAYIPTSGIDMFFSGTSMSAGNIFGCVYIPELGMHRFLLWAPNAQEISLTGSFNDWNETSHPMEKVYAGVWAAFVPGLKDGDLYKYSILRSDGTRVLKSDPFASFGECRSKTASIVWTGKYYGWHDGAFLKKRAETDAHKAPMNIYELHPGTWEQDENGRSGYRSLAERLPAYLSAMHYTHAELMPINEYPYDGSWGYQTTGYYAPTSRYGSPEDLKYLVDRLHAVNIGVIFDWVPAHFPRDEHGLAEFDGTPLYECKERRMAEHPDWGTLIFDYSSLPVRSFLLSSACRLFEEFHADGIRVDAVSSMLYLDYSRAEGQYTKNRLGGNINLEAVDFLRLLNRSVQKNYPGTVTIAEESSAYPMVSRPEADGGLGFSFKWDMGFMHDTLEYMMMDPIYRKYHHDRLTFSMLYCYSENFILAFSHDEVVHGKGSMLNKMFGDYEQKFSSLRAFYGYQFGHPGKKLNFMGSEIAPFTEFSEGRPLEWFLLNYPAHASMKEFCRELNHLYLNCPAMYEDDDSWNGFQWLTVDDCDKSTVVFMRIPRSGGDRLVCACNFTPVTYNGYKTGLPFKGTLKEVLNSDALRFGGTGVVNPRAIRTRRESVNGFDNSAVFDLPPMACVFFRYKTTEK